MYVYFSQMAFYFGLQQSQTTVEPEKCTSFFAYIYVTRQTQIHYVKFVLKK